jgi:uncharacterized protein (TIRG00374 family)
MKKILFRAVISVAFLVLLYFLVRDEFPSILQVLNRADRPMIAVSVLLFLLTVAVMAWRLRIILAVKGLRISLSEGCQLTFVGFFFNNFLPTSVGGDIVKAMCAARITKSTVHSITSILMDRMFGLFTFILIPSLTLLFFMRQIGNPMVPKVVYTFFGLSCLCFFLLFNRKVGRKLRFLQNFMDQFGLGRKLREVYEGLHDFVNHKWVVFFALALSIAGQTVSILVLYLMGLAMGIHTAMIYFFLLVPVIQLVSMLPSLNGLGIREGAFIYFLTPYMGKEYAAALGILWLGLLIFLSVIGGVVYLIRHDYHIRFKEAVIPQEALG